VFYNPTFASALSSQVVFCDRVPNAQYSFSDHFGVEAVISLESQQQQQQPSETVELHPIFKSMLDNIDVYTQRAQTHMQWRYCHLGATIPALLALFIGVFWVPGGWPAFLIVLASTVIGTTGMVNGLLIGFVFGRWELGRVKEFEEEITMALNYNPKSSRS
jgi:sphingomyelin phosphodiesterase 2